MMETRNSFYSNETYTLYREDLSPRERKLVGKAEMITLFMAKV